MNKNLQCKHYFAIVTRTENLYPVFNFPSEQLEKAHEFFGTFDEREAILFTEFVDPDDDSYVLESAEVEIL